MPTKDCRLYYALLPKGSVAPTAANFKTGSITGNLGYGVVDVKKNTPLLIPRVNTAYLKEETTYDLYLWLNDADNGKSSAVKKLTVTTLDMTPPVLQSIRVSDVAARSVSVTFSVNEPATLYWAVVKHGADFLAADKNTQAAKIQIESGVGALKKGSANAAKAATEVKFTVSGLEGQTLYDLYYVVKDKAGNYNVYTMEFAFPLPLNTLDNEPPTVKQEFTHDGTDSGKLPTPYPDTSIRLVFSESVKGKTQDGTGKPVYNEFKKLYDDMLSAPVAEREAARKALADALRAHIKLYYRPASGQPTLVAEKTADVKPADWVIDYRYATVTLDADSGEMIVTFPYNKDKPGESAINLSSGVTYYFELSGIVDTSTAENAMVGSRGVTKLPEFTTIDAQLVFSAVENSGTLTSGAAPDMTFRISPVTASSVSDSILWDMVIWSDKTLSFEIYQRTVGTDVWEQIGNQAITISTTSDEPRTGVTLAGALGMKPEQLKKFATDREYAIKVTSLGGSATEKDWSGKVELTLLPVSGTDGTLKNLADLSLTPDKYKELQASNYAVKEIGVPKEYTVSRTFRDQNPPTFSGDRPTFTVGDSSANIDIMLNRPNTKFYYVVTQAGNITTTLNNAANTQITDANWDTLPENGDGLTPDDIKKNGNVSAPLASTITSGTYQNQAPRFLAGTGRYDGSMKTVKLTGLEASTKYIAYIVLQGESPESTSGVYAFRFQTENVVRPTLSVLLNNPEAIVQSVPRSHNTTAKDASVKYLLIVSGQESDALKQTMDTCWDEDVAKAAGLKDQDITNCRQYKTLTLIQAMAQSYSVGGYNQGSIFDLFAKQTVQNEIANSLNAASTNDTSIMASGTMNLDTRNNWTQTSTNCKSGMNPNNPNMTYWFVAIGKSPLGSGYAFSAGGFLYYPDNTPPQVISIATNTTTTPLEKDPLKAEKAYSGEVTITFSTPLYLKEESGGKVEYFQVVDKSLANLGVNSNCKSSTLLLRGTDLSVVPGLKKNDPNAPCVSLTIQYTNITFGKAFTFSPFLSNSRGITGTKPLSIVMRKFMDKDGLYRPRFDIANAGSEWGKPTIDPS